MVRLDGEGMGRRVVEDELVRGLPEGVSDE